MNDSLGQVKQRQEDARNTLLQQVVTWMELPMVILGFVWLLIFIADYVHGLSRTIEIISMAIWIVFVLDFLLEFVIAPKKLDYLTHNWLMLIALCIPALRIFRFLQVTRIIQGARLVRVLSSINRSMHALGASLGRHGFRYVMALTLIVTFAGAAGMYAFERPNLRNYPDALWWTTMIMTTLGSGYWPKTTEGRILCVILALYAFSVFGYVTAALATFLVGREAELDGGEIAGGKAVNALSEEINHLREEVRILIDRLPKDGE